MADEENGPNILEPLKSQGIRRLEENAIILGTKFMAKPRSQFVLRRIAYEKIKEAFAEHGIQFAPRTVTVAGPSDPDHGAAALAAVEADAKAATTVAARDDRG